MGSKEAPLLRLTSRVTYGGRILTPGERAKAVEIGRYRWLESLRAALRAETRKLRRLTPPPYVSLGADASIDLELNAKQLYSELQTAERKYTQGMDRIGQGTNRAGSGDR
jgi:hypothetical protein